jgi:hypothetical protein
MGSLFIGQQQRACMAHHAVLGLFLLGLLTACSGGVGSSSAGSSSKGKMGTFYFSPCR